VYGLQRNKLQIHQTKGMFFRLLVNPGTWNAWWAIGWGKAVILALTCIIHTISCNVSDSLALKTNSVPSFVKAAEGGVSAASSSLIPLNIIVGSGKGNKGLGQIINRLTPLFEGLQYFIHLFVWLCG
jgi:hypothetical protein